MKGTYFWSTPRFGTHELRAGYEDFNEVRDVNNYQNGSDFRISVASTIVRGDQIFPRMPGGATGTLTRISWLPIFVLSEGSDYRRAPSSKLSGASTSRTFNLGVRYDKTRADRRPHVTIADDSSLNPRLAPTTPVRQGKLS